MATAEAFPSGDGIDGNIEVPSGHATCRPEVATVGAKKGDSHCLTVGGVIVFLSCLFQGRHGGEDHPESCTISSCSLTSSVFRGTS